jgi:hydrogenase maturation factor
MCRTTVGTVLAVEAGVALVELGGVQRSAIALTVPDLAVGDHVLVGLGTVLGRVTPEDRAVLEAIDLRPRPHQVPGPVAPRDGTNGGL